MDLVGGKLNVAPRFYVLGAKRPENMGSIHNGILR